jgi:DNA replication protein DnaC
MKLEKRKHQSIGFIKAKDLIKLASKVRFSNPDISMIKKSLSKVDALIIDE